MIETAGYEAAAVRNHSPEKETNILVIIIITSSKRYYMSRRKYLLFISSLFQIPSFQKFQRKKENIYNSSEFSFHYPSISKLETNSKSSSRLFEQAILTKFSKTSIKVNGSIFLRAIVTVDCEQRGSEQATRNGIINDRSSLSFTARFDSHMAWSIEEKEARVHRRATFTRVHNTTGERPWNNQRWKFLLGWQHFTFSLAVPRVHLSSKTRARPGISATTVRQIFRSRPPPFFR